MKVRRKINAVDVERAIKKILSEQGITRKCLNYLAENVDELQADYITSIMGKIKMLVREAESLSQYRKLIETNQRYILLIAIILFRAQMACGTLPPLSIAALPAALARCTTVLARTRRPLLTVAISTA